MVQASVIGAALRRANPTVYIALSGIKNPSGAAYDAVVGKALRVRLPDVYRRLEIALGGEFLREAYRQ
jgi:hypothetical protein